MYNLTNITNADNILQTYVAVNQLSNNLLANSIVIAIWIIIFIVFKRQPFSKVLLGSSFMMILITFYMFTIHMVGWVMPSFVVVVFFVSLIWNLFGGD